MLESPEALQRFVAAWENGTLPKPEWTHAAHVAVCACMLVRYPGDGMAAMSAGIIRYNEAVGTVNSETSGYHATLAQFWYEVLQAYLQGMTQEWDAAAAAVCEFGGARDLHRRFYSFDVVRSIEARLTWIAPDLLDHRTAFGKIA